MHTASEIMALRAAIGLGVNAAKAFLKENPPCLIERILAAAIELGRIPGAKPNESERHLFLQDPVEKDPEVGGTIGRVLDEEAQRMVQLDGTRFCGCHLLWRNTKARLKDEYGIEWYSPAELNPGRCFD